MADEIGKILIKQEEIKLTVKNIAENIINDNPDKKAFIFITVLKGAKYFADDLIRELKKLKDVKIRNEFVKVSSYKGAETTGKIKVEEDIKLDLFSRDVFIIEDIVDTGLTLNFLKDYLLNVKKAKSVKICSFLDKPSRRKVYVDIDYKGFEVPDKFIIGYGLDYEQKYRELPYVAEYVEE